MIEYENLKKLNQKFETTLQREFQIFLDSGWYILGQSVRKFEESFANYLESPYCVGVGNGLDAMILAIESLNLPPKSEIIVPSNTYIATILAVLRTGHIPILVEPDIATYNIDPSKIEDKLTDKTHAILVVHLYGKSCNMEPIVKLATERNLHLIEDCAQSHGSRYKGKKTGTFGIGCFSFYPTKNLGALGDGGAIVTNDHNLALKLKTLRNYGSEKKYENLLIGINSRLDEIQAYFLNIKLPFLDEINQHKRNLAAIYFANLSKELIVPVVDSEYYDVYHIFNVRTSHRDKLKDHLAKNDIKTEIHYPIPPHKQVAMKKVLTGEYPISEEIHNTTLSLPISYYHTESDVIEVCNKINQFFR
ncbi:DegT/DnrJ/EryC1/StrS family aminotransferase [Leptospira sp. 201903075]|uniref:DegT/DnrJ/EryC1/StrS family aminotransferase n=1 Tax=Leptospira chreensis TaxID=2810035 RepID=UPI001964D838|nr:DegT/DnrJ/EryC1/StrS family aminotransferase [Leptospira chreensis]MBM9590255.1 DegT/DnrJ/EryC1/StrS family aminotransferase [Leptospira chreensis]